MSENSYCWKWSLGESYIKSARPKKQERRTNNNSLMEPIDNTYNAINQSLNDDSMSYRFDNDMIDITNSVFSRNQIDQQNNSKREDLDTRIADREMIAQRGINPFLTNSNYVNDIHASDNFLKPINTSSGK